MVEAIQCPSCQTKYRLRPTRVRSGLRRAQCFRCGDVFHIDTEVKRLLSVLEPTSTANVPLTALSEAIQQSPEYLEAPTPSLEANDLALGDLEIPEPEMAESAPASAQSGPSPSDTSPIPSMTREPAQPMAEATEALPEAVMADFELPPVPEAAALDVAPEGVPEPEPSGTYASARDAIARLFGDTPLAPPPTANLRNALDMDAGMEALDNTLGGVSVDSLSTKPFTAPAAEAPSQPAAHPMEADELPHASATLRMTAIEVASATESATGSAVSKVPEPPEITQEEVTMVFPPPPSAAPLDPSDPSALRLRIGDQTYGGLDLPTIAKWIEEGRVLEDHQVARGMSENWMDASTVPALRSVFERLRRARLGGGDSLPPPPGIPDTGQLKRGLFGGIFGK